MTTQPDLLKAIRTGRLAAVIAALDDGVPIEPVKLTVPLADKLDTLTGF